VQQRVLEGKIAIVTGAASPRGLGRAMTEALVKAGARVSMMDINQQWLDETSNYMREIGGDDCVMAQVVDVSSIGEVERSIERTIDESLRLFPIVPFGARIASTDVEIAGHQLARKTRVLIPFATLHHDPSVFPEPNRFQPDRWLSGEPVEVSHR